MLPCRDVAERHPRGGPRQSYKLPVWALNSYAASAQRFAHCPTFFIADDSADVTQQQANRVAARCASDAYETKILYAGRNEKAAYLCALTESGDLPPAAVRFALFGTEGATRTYGANRNAILLQTSGAPVLSVNDDTLELSRFLRQVVKTQFSLNGELCHGIGSTNVHA
jgi:hypothetical protein